MDQNANLLLGALVADAACLGLHWIYNVERIAEVAERQNGQCAFTPVEARNFEGVKTFAHKERHNGMFTQIGETLYLAIQSMNAHGGTFEAEAYQSEFSSFFGFGGAYRGFIDAPTRGALANIAAGVTPAGIDDKQTPALTRLPAILVAYHGQSNLHEMIQASMQVTNINDEAYAYNLVFADLIGRVMEGHDLNAALHASASAAASSIKDDLLTALSTDEADSTVFAGRTGLMGRACYLSSAAPVIFHILARSSSYKEAIERNILAAGDSAGRAIMIGAIMGRIHGIATPNGLPLAWALQLEDGAKIWADCELLASFSQH